MTPDQVAELLRDIDVIEADMRRLETRLTHIRERIHKAFLGGAFSRYESNGRKKGEKPIALEI